MEAKRGDIVKFQLVNGLRAHTGEVTKVIPESEKDPHVTSLLNYDYLVDVVKDGRTFELQIYEREILEVL